ncbi:WXG100 family type VII secretion target [Streptosporangium sp. NPDC000396]|uniref:WXG100 family type VII secretion target n=1 Tax=Streptosporangium sp. NPDC000396 TaxID=3366185 RepID=UPI0036A90525
MADQSQTQVSEADLVQAVNWIEDSAEKIRGIQQRLDQAGHTLKVNWKGDSHAAFNKVHQNWHDRIDVILMSLKDLAEKVAASNKNYRAFNEQAVTEINKIEALINASSGY